MPSVSEGGREPSPDAEREWACAALPALGLSQAAPHRAGPLAAVPSVRRAECSSLHLLCLCQAHQLFSGTQIFNYLLLLDFNREPPGCVQKYLPPPLGK